MAVVCILKGNVTWTVLRATAENGEVVIFCEFLNHTAFVVILILKCPELLKQAGENVQVEVALSC